MVEPVSMMTSLDEYRELSRQLLDQPEATWTYEYTTNPYYHDGIVFTHKGQDGARRKYNTLTFVDVVVGPLQEPEKPRYARLRESMILAHILRSEIELRQAEVLLGAVSLVTDQTVAEVVHG